MRLATASAALLGATAALGGVAALRGKKNPPGAAGLSELAEVAVQDAQAHRSAMEDMGGMGHMEHPAFAPLPCNAPVDTADTSMCVNWSEQGYNASALVTVPCGMCVTLDATGPLDLPGGLNVEGKLRVPVDELGADYAVDVRAPFVVVQGILDVSSSRTVSPANEAVKFTLTGPGDADLDLAPMVHAHNSAACMGHGGCGVGRKPFAVVGGRMDIAALPAQCPSWTRIEDIVARPVAVPDPAAVPAYVPPSAGCDSSGAFLSEGFSVGDGGWVNNGGAGEFADVDSHAAGDRYFRVSNRASSWNGPLVDVDPSCLVPDALYVIRAKAKLVLAAGFAGAESSCQSSGQKCLQAVYKHVEAGGGNPTWNGLGNKYTDYPGDGIWYDIVTTDRFSQKEVTPGDEAKIYFDGPEPGIDVLIDDVSIELAGPEYYPPAADTCSQLVVNGGADNFVPDPVYTNAWGTNLRVESEDGNRFFSLKDRYGYWHSAETKLLPDCVVEGDVYTFSVKLRVRTATPVRAKLLLKATTDPNVDADHTYDMVKHCPEQTESDGWVECSADHAFTSHQAGAGVVRFYVEIPEDETAVVDFDDFSVAHRSGPATGLRLPADVLPCWDVGSEVLVTSHTLRHDDASVRTIAGTSADAAAGDAVLDLDAPVPFAVTTRADVAANPDVALATEVALLTRNVKFESADVAEGSKQGAHLIVYHTPDVDQTVEGVEVRKFGQAGTLGRYPMHFHMCGDVDGSVLSKNVVRESFQRCYVVHGTHNLTLADNVAYDTFGHCYFLEDGAEMGNSFLRNLGAVTKRQPSADMITAQSETDNDCSTFWMTNPMNTWEGNVAAGSEHSGFWFEMRTSVRGPSADMHPDMNPKVLPLGPFTDNVMHSNEEHGLKTYPGSGYEPDVEAVFAGTKSYRNKGSGVFFHNSRNLALEGGFFSDNRRQVDFDRAPTTRISNAKVTGYSPLYKDAVAADGGNWYHFHCPSSTPLVGVQLHTFWKGSDRERGSTVENVQFSHLGEADTGCQGSRAVNVDAENKGYFDVRTSLGGLSFDGVTDKFEACTAAADGGVDFVAIRDDGSVSGQAGFIVSDSPRMTNLLPDGMCAPLPDACAASCPGLCLRSRLYRVSGLAAADLALVVTDAADPSKSVEIPGYFERSFLDAEMTVPDVNEDTLVWRDRVFHVVVPETGGPYEAKFRLHGEDHWPRFVEVVDEDVPGNCGTAFPAIDVLEPAVPEGYCDDLIYNGDMELGLDGWQNNGGGLAIHAQGVTGQALKSDVRNSNWNGPGQFLDTRCLVEGETYLFEAKVKAARDSDGVDPGCDVHGSGCPKAVMIVQTDSDPETRHWVSVASPGTQTGSWDTGEWNNVVAAFVITPEMAAAESVFLYFESAPAGVDIIIDNVSITPYVEVETVCGDTILNEGFTDSIEGWNGNYNPGGFERSMTESHTQDDPYFWVHGRTATWHGPMVEFDIGCLVPGQLYFLSAKVKYEITPDHANGAMITCETDADYCISATYYRRDSDDQPHWRSFGGKKKRGAGEWFEYSATYTFSEDDLTPGNTHRLYFERPEAGVDIKIDDVFLRAAPSVLFPSEAELCDEMLVNGGAELAPPFTYPNRANAWKTTLSVESETVGGELNHFFQITGRWGNWHSAEYDLHTTCITAGEVYTFAVKTRVHTSTPVTPKVIIKAEPMNEYKLITYCPQQSGGTDWVECTADYTWTANQGSASRVKFWIEVPEDINADVDYDDFSFAPKVSTD